MATISSVNRLFSSVLASFILVLALSGCSDPEPERSMRDILSEIEGTQLTPAETQVLVDTANLLCAMNQDALKPVLSEVDANRLDFLDWVFSEHCGARERVYKQVLEESFPEHVEKSDS